MFYVLALYVASLTFFDSIVSWIVSTTPIMRETRVFLENDATEIVCFLPGGGHVNIRVPILHKEHSDVLPWIS